MEIRANAGVGSSTRVILRGESILSQNGNQPLFVVDGVPIINSSSEVSEFGNSYDYGQVYVTYVPGKNVKKDIPQYGFSKGYLETKEDLNEPTCSIAEAISKQKLFMNPLLANHGLNLLDELLTKEQMIYHVVYVSLETLASKSINWNG